MDVFVALKQGTEAETFIEKKGLKEKKARKVKQDLISARLSALETEELRKDSDDVFVEKIERVHMASDGFVKANKAGENDQTIPWGVHAIGADISQDASKAVRM
ncbi:MAG: hypothetical protein ACQEXQ_11745 [Bacillota bacterium]